MACGLITAFFPDEVDDSLDSSTPTGRFSPDLGRWPTDFSGDIQPVACASHNDYWRKEPLFSALKAGCTGVEADVWLFDQDLFVGHSTQSLTPERTLRSLYLDPLLKILGSQNSISSFHPSSDLPPSGVFDTKPSQTLVLLIDFKNDGDAIWPYVSDQLQPFREKKYLTYFNGSSVIEGPITVVVTGNAPFSSVVANPHYRDIFFDAPLGLMDKLSNSAVPVGASVPNGDTADAVRSTIPSPRSEGDQGQGQSGSAPTNPSIYSPANSYYASVDFRASIGFPWRGHLSSQQKEKIRKQIAGAHERGLKVRYWNVPSWPRGLRNYLWRVLVREGVDYLNVDDLHSATKGNWGWGRRGPWWSGPWRFWPSTTTRG